MRKLSSAGRSRHRFPEAAILNALPVKTVLEQTGPAAVCQTALLALQNAIATALKAE